MPRGKPRTFDEWRQMKDAYDHAMKEWKREKEEFEKSTKEQVRLWHSALHKNFLTSDDRYAPRQRRSCFWAVATGACS